MGTFGDTFNRMAWNMVCAKLNAKAYLNSLYGVKIQSRGYGKTITTQALYREIMTRYARYYNYISVRWCECFEILDNGKRRYCYVYVAKK